MKQRHENILICLMFVSWAVLRVTTADPADRWSIPQWIPAVLHMVVALLFLQRNPWTHNGDVASIAWSLPSFVAGGLAINLAPAPHLWSLAAQLIFLLGAGGAVIGMIFLGRSFAIFPAIRTIVDQGPFRVIRHPIYFFELVMIAGCCVAASQAWHWNIFLFAVLAIIVRIASEEKILRQSEDYVVFAQTVRYRLIPGVW